MIHMYPHNLKHVAFLHLKAKEPWDYENLQERLGDASQLKERGGKYFKEGKYALAKKLYKRGAELITDTSIRKEEVKEEAKPMRVALHLNIAACYLKLEEADEALKECDEVRDLKGQHPLCEVSQPAKHSYLSRYMCVGVA